MLKKFAITGPESTGKTEMAKSLASYFNTSWVPEFAREYLNNLGKPYSYEDILIIAQTQYQQNQNARTNSKNYIFCDTELLVTKIWCEYKYQKCHPWILKHLLRQDFDLYLLLDINLPWEPDPLREHPTQRQYFFDLYKSELESMKVPYKIITGIGKERMNNALSVISQLD